MCSCGATLLVEWGDDTRAMLAQDAARAQTLLDQFRRDHKTCRIVMAAKERT